MRNMREKNDRQGNGGRERKKWKGQEQGIKEGNTK